MKLCDLITVEVVRKIAVSVLVLGLGSSYSLAELPQSGTSHYSSRSDSGTRSSARDQTDAARDESLSLNSQGWHTWTVAAVDNARDWCCTTWQNKEVVSTSCDLDRNAHSGGITRRGGNGRTDEVQIYAKLDQGKAKAIRVFGATCDVTSKNSINNHGAVSATASLDWLSRQMSKERHIAGQALTAIAVHDSEQAQVLLRRATGEDKAIHLRKDAIFWMGQVRARQSINDLTHLMLNDDDDEIREHTVFSVSQSELESRLDLIERVAREDQNTKVRGQAWFWLAQTEDADAARRIFAGMSTERDTAVLKQAVFALSQLPEDEAINALIRVVEDKRSERTVRKQALFWMAQSRSERAAEYLAAVLDR